jgi:hypothetical protein
MKFDTLQALFTERNTGGTIDFLGDGRYYVYFGKGKLYTYRSPSHYALAERFELIPEFDVSAEARRVVAGLMAGAGSVVADAAAGDTANWLWRGDGYITSTNEFLTDDYGRQLRRFVIGDNCDGW